MAEIALGGEVHGLRPGDTAVVASYNGRLASARVTVPTGRVVTIPDVPDCDLIDREVFAKLRSLGITPSRPSADAEFLRRVTLDAIGTLPAPQEVRAFLDDPSSDKRARKIDELLVHPMHAALVGHALPGYHRLRRRGSGGPGRCCVHAGRGCGTTGSASGSPTNTPYSEIARGVITATSRDGVERRSRGPNRKPRG